jgi:uncharacterized protein with ParB-like and HNH nuclease domain
MIGSHFNAAMPFQSENIAMIIDQINNQYYLPAIQREFVWHQDQIIKLFDSIMRGYPISSFLFWAVKEPNYNNYDIYSFTENYIEGETHNAKAPTDGFKQVTLALDGQQRLTSLLIGLKGSYSIRKRYSKNKQKVTQRLYLDLLKDPSNVDDNNEDGIHYGFEFLEDVPITDGIHYWLRAGRILECDNPDQFQNFKYEEMENLPNNVTKGQMWTFQKNLDRLYQAVWKDAVISYYIEQDQDENRVLDIFIRANEGGTKLSKSDLLLSMVTLKWEQYNAKDEIYEFVDLLNNDLPRKNNFDKDFIMKACLVLSGLPVQYRVSNFNKENLGKIEKNWGTIKKATESGVRLINTFGIDRDTLTSANALIPIIYYLYKNPKLNLLECTPSNVKDISLIRTWFTMALLNNVFSGHSDTVLNETRKVLDDNQDQEEFPVSSLNNELSKMQRNTYFDDTTIDNFLEISYGKQNTFLALSLLYDNNSWGSSQFHQDHIFPKSLFTKERMSRAGISPEQQERYRVLKDQIGNLELISSHENEKKLSEDFDIWIFTRDESFKKSNLIPCDESIYGFDKFEKFVEERETLIRARLKRLFIPIQLREEP